MTTTNKITIPIIRQAFPATIAQQIAGVQPMAATTGSIFNMTPTTSANVTYHHWWPTRSAESRADADKRMLIICDDVTEWDHSYPKGIYGRILTSYAVFVYSRDTRTFACLKDRASLKRPCTYLQEIKIPVSLLLDGTGRYQLDDTPAGMLAAMKYGL